MARLHLTLGCGDYDRTWALQTGEVAPEGIDLNYIPLEPEEVFWRMVRYGEFDAAELSLGSYLIRRSNGLDDFIAIPVFPSRFFRHSGIYVNANAGIREPQDLIGRRVGVPEYQITAATWARGLLEHEYGVAPHQMLWFTGGMFEPGRVEKQHISVSEGVQIEPIPEGRTLSEMLATGEIDALVAPRHPSTFGDGSGAVRRLFPNFREVEQDYFRRTGIFPIMHTIALRRNVLDAHPWVAQSLYKAFEEAKRCVFDVIGGRSALGVSLPWLMAEWEETRRLMGDDFWPYGLGESNRRNIETLIQYSHEQGLIAHRPNVSKLFAASTEESFKI